MDRNVNLRVVDGSKSSVALRKESVDRNVDAQNLCISIIVALRKESVDRNLGQLHCHQNERCRSPQGERG